MIERLRNGDVASPNEIRKSQILHNMIGRQGHPAVVNLLDHVLPFIEPEILLNDTAAQIKLRDMLVDHRHGTQRRKNPPMVELHARGANHAGTPGYSSSERERFRLKDPNHTYFLTDDPSIPPTHSVRNEMPLTETNIKSAINVPVIRMNRVPHDPGPVEVYNYEIRQWQPHPKKEFMGVGVGNRRMNGVRLNRVYGRQKTTLSR
jgi:hypothetical protein